MAIQADIRHAITTLMETLPDIGNVYDRQRYASADQEFLNLFAFDWNGFRTFRGWWLSAPTLRGQGRNQDAFDEHWDTYTFTIRGIHGFKADMDSESAFEALVYLVRDTLHVQGTMGLTTGSDRVISGSIDVVVPTLELRQFGSYLCHYVELVMSVGVDSPAVWVP